MLKAHQLWIEEESARGQIIRSGFLVDQDQRPGGGGLLIFEAASYAKALEWVQNDPMIRAGLVDWQVQEWIFFVNVVTFAFSITQLFKMRSKELISILGTAFSTYLHFHCEHTV